MRGSAMANKKKFTYNISSFADRDNTVVANHANDEIETMEKEGWEVHQIDTAVTAVANPDGTGAESIPLFSIVLTFRRRA